MPGPSLAIPGLSLLVLSQFQDVPDSSWLMCSVILKQLQQTKFNKDNELILISEKYLIQDNFLFMCEQCQKGYLKKEKENTEVKKSMLII